MKILLLENHFENTLFIIFLTNEPFQRKLEISKISAVWRLKNFKPQTTVDMIFEGHNHTFEDKQF
jgi:2',3'-cyclic-nucleotide 2'-phosphodiesterase (5'-nucleotidase family)